MLLCSYALALSLQQQEITTANESRRQQAAERDHQLRQQHEQRHQQQQQHQQRWQQEHDATTTSMKRKSKQNCVIS